MATKDKVAVGAGNEIVGDGSGVALAPIDGTGIALQPMAEPEGGWPADEFTGKGGSYVRDPYTGIRTPTPETAAALAAAAAAQ